MSRELQQSEAETREVGVGADGYVEQVTGHTLQGIRRGLDLILRERESICAQCRCP